MNNFMPDSGKIMVYRSGGGFGVRLDSGNAYTGAIITPYYDSLLVKTTTYGRNHKEAAQKMLRVLKEFRIRGVKTNIGFLINVLKSPEFIAGTYNVNFIDDHPELFNLPVVQDRGTKLLKYIGDTTINGYATPVIRINRFLKRWNCRHRSKALIQTGRNRNSMPWDRKNSLSGSKNRRRSSSRIRPCATLINPCSLRASVPSICSESWKRLLRNCPISSLMNAGAVLLLT